MDDVIEPAPTLEYRIKNLEAFVKVLKEEMEDLKKFADAVSFETLKLRDEIFD